MGVLLEDFQDFGVCLLLWFDLLQRLYFQFLFSYEYVRRIESSI